MPQPAPADTGLDPLPATHLPQDPLARVPAALRPALQARGFTTLTPVQVAALAAAEAGRDLRISSQTGSGKTVALGFVMAPRLLAPASARTGPEAMVIVPTRELAAQVRGELEWLYAGVPGVTLECVTGGTDLQGERRRLARRPRILVGTPGRLLDHIRSGILDCTGVAQVALDEADQMLDLGFREDLEAILSAMPVERRTHLVSATLPRPVLELADRYQTAALHVEGTRLGAANADIEHVALTVRPCDRLPALVNLLLLASDRRTLVFVRTRAGATTLAEELARDGFAAAAISGELAQAQRTRTLNAFRLGTIAVLVATDVAARGLDIADVPRVVHFDAPMDSEVYTHRSGRTGRAGNKGTSILLAPPSARRRVERLCRGARVQLTWGEVPTAAAVQAALIQRTQDRVHAAIAAAATSDGAPSPARTGFARELLAGRDPVQVVAALLGFATAEPAGVARDIAPVAAERPAPFRGPDRGPGRHEDQGERRQGSPRFTRFSINWGSDTGANPQRLLAHVCRRGDVASRAIGGIDIGAAASTFEVASDLAGDFARRVQRPDRRDPGVRIVPVGGHFVARPVRQAGRHALQGPGAAARRCRATGPDRARGRVVRPGRSR